MINLKTGDAVLIDCAGKKIAGTVLLASSNGKSLMLEFEAILDGHVGMMPVSRDDGGAYYSIVTGKPVTLKPIQQ